MMVKQINCFEATQLVKRCRSSPHAKSLGGEKTNEKQLATGEGGEAEAFQNKEGRTNHQT